MRLLGHGVIVVVLTVLSQLGGLAWFLALVLARRRGWLVFVVAFLAFHGGFSASARVVAPIYGRVAIPCSGEGAVAHSWMFCALNRTYVTPELARVLDDLAAHIDNLYPGRRVRVLDAGFPFGEGFPLLPHLSHDDGRKADLAFWYEGEATRSPIGYWAFEEPAPSAAVCASTTWWSMRWNMAWLQPWMGAAALDEEVTREAIVWLKAVLPGGRIFLEPYLARRLRVTGDPVGFQGCRAARHDDHIHIQL